MKGRGGGKRTDVNSSMDGEKGKAVSFRQTNKDNLF